MTKMFCPACATENASEQAYCRRCGLALTEVELALKGTTTESLAKLRSGSHLMNGGIASLASFMFVAVMIALIGATQDHPVFMAVAMLNAVIGALIGLPLIIAGKTRISRAAHLLSAEKSRRSIEQKQTVPSLNKQSPTNPLVAPGSVTEHTTLDLRSHRKV